MDSKILIGILVLLTSCGSNNDKKSFKSNPTHISNDSILILPKIGIDDISFYAKDNVESFHYKHVIFIVDSGQSVSDATNGAYFKNWTRFKNDTMGLSFTFSTPYNVNPNLVKEQPKTLTEISIWNNQTAHFDNGIKIGTSTYQEVVSEFGQLPADWHNNFFIEYPIKGIKFSFDSNRILQGVNLKKISD